MDYNMGQFDLQSTTLKRVSLAVENLVPLFWHIDGGLKYTYCWHITSRISPQGALHNLFWIFRWFEFILTAWHMANFHWQFRTLPFGFFSQIWIKGTLRLILGYFWNMPLFDNSRAIWVLFKNGCSQKIKVFSRKEWWLPPH